jgi:adenylate cyclase
MNADDQPTLVDLAREADFQLGPLRVRPSTREILAEGRTETLEPRVMQVLVVLARRRGHVVSRDELTVACWGGRAVSEDAISRCIAAIRRLAQAHGGFSVTTVLRVGFRIDETFASSAAAPTAPQKPTLAVLAFDNLSDDRETAYFSDGVSEEILHTVARGADLSVIGRASSFHFRGAQKAAANVGAELNATHVLDGSVRRSGARVRIAAHLIECAGQTTLWSGRFDRELADVFALQDEIAAAVASALTAVFTPAGSTGSIDPAAYDLYLKAVHPTVVNAPARQRSTELLERVTDLAPRFARAWASLAWARASRLRTDGTDRPYPKARAEVVDAAETALRLDSGLGLVHQVLGYLEPFAQFEAREALQDKALAVSPNDPDVLTEASRFFGVVGRTRHALGFAKRAFELDPMSPTAARRYAILLAATGDYEACVGLWDRFHRLWPDNETVLGHAISIAAGMGDWARFDALVEHVRGTALDTRQMREMIAHTGSWRRPDARVIQASLNGLRDQLDRTGTVGFGSLMRGCQLGLMDETFELIERASFAYMFDETQRWPDDPVGMSQIFNRAYNRWMIDDPRFVGFCARLGLCDYWIGTGRWPDCADDGVAPYDFRAEASRVAIRRNHAGIPLRPR